MVNKIFDRAIRLLRNLLIRYLSPFTDAKGNQFRYAEVYRKAMLFNDLISASKILNCSNPKEVKALGRSVVGFDEQIWKKHRESIVFQGKIYGLLNHLKVSIEPTKIICLCDFYAFGVGLLHYIKSILRVFFLSSFFSNSNR